jgi:uncharacterized RDD family membrane protein YckC
MDPEAISSVRRRVGAVFFDVLTWFVFWGFYQLPLFSISFSWSYVGHLRTNLSVIHGLSALYCVCVFYAYVVMFEFLFGKTIGKKVFGIQIVSKDMKGLTLRKILLRNLGKLVDICCGPIFILLSSDNRSFGDSLGGTVVLCVHQNKESTEKVMESITSRRSKRIGLAVLFSCLYLVQYTFLGITLYKIHTFDSLVRGTLIKSKHAQVARNFKELQSLFTKSQQKENTIEDIVYLYDNETQYAMMRAFEPDHIQFNTWEFSDDGFLFRRQDTKVYVEIYMQKDIDGVYRISSHTIDVVDARPILKPLTEKEEERMFQKSDEYLKRNESTL